MKTRKYQVGQPFPERRYVSGQNSCAIFNEHFFDIVVSLFDLTIEEIQAFQKGKMQIGLFIRADVPFLYIDFNVFTFVIYINIKEISDEKVTDWLDAKANTITLILVEGRTGIIQVIRTISIDFADEIKNVLKNQIHHTRSEIDISVLDTVYNIPIEDIIKMATRKIKFPPIN